MACFLGCLEGSSDLNLSVPFKAGDIVNLDCSPFADPMHLLILNNKYNWDCCGSRGVVADDKGHVHVDSVKHSHCFPEQYRSRLSPFYRMYTYSGELLENEKGIREIQLDMMDYPESERDAYGETFENIW